MDGGLFDNATYEFYTGTLGRSAVPSAEEFAVRVGDNVLFLKRLVSDGIVSEREADGLSAAACRMAEIDYLAEKDAEGGGPSVASESINGYSVSYDNTARQEAARLNARSVVARKLDVIKLYNDYDAGVL